MCQLESCLESLQNFGAFYKYMHIEEILFWIGSVKRICKYKGVGAFLQDSYMFLEFFIWYYP